MIMDVSIVRVPAVEKFGGQYLAVNDDRLGLPGHSSSIRHDKALERLTACGSTRWMSGGIHSAFGDGPLIIVGAGRIYVTAQRTVSVPCARAYLSKFGVLVSDGKSISLITEAKSFPRATELIAGLMIAPIIEDVRDLVRQFSIGGGEVLSTVDIAKRHSSFILRSAECILLCEHEISHINDDIALTSTGVYAAIDLRGDHKPQIVSDILPCAYIPTKVGIRYAAKIRDPTQGSYDYIIITITRRVPESCVVCAVSGQLVRAVVDCGHIVHAHERCVEIIAKCSICDKSTDRAIVVRD